MLFSSRYNHHPAQHAFPTRRSSDLGNYDVQLRFNDDRMDANLKLQEPANGPLENLLQVPGLGDLSVVAQLSGPRTADRKSTRLNSSHANISYAVFCLKKKTQAGSRD